MAAQAQRRVLDDLLAVIDEGVLLFSPSGDLVFANPNAKEMFGLPEKNNNLSNWHNGLHFFALNSDKEIPSDQILNVLTQNDSQKDQSYKITLNNGNERVINISGDKLENEKGEVVSIVLRLRDLSVRHTINGKPAHQSSAGINLSPADIELESFIYCISHDLQAPLRHIMGFSGLLADEFPESVGEQGKLYVDRIQSACEQIQKEIMELLQLSRKTRGRMFLSVVNLSNLAEAIIRDLQEREPERKIKVFIQEGIEVKGDQRLLFSLMENLLDNAWKFSRDKKDAMIRFGAEKGEETIRYFVKDNGIGLDTTHNDKLFLPFKKFHSGGFEGDGMGLATALRIINRHGGNIWLESEPGKSTTVLFTLP